MAVRSLLPAFTVIVALLGVLTLPTAAVAADEGGFMVSPSRVDLEITPGGTKTTTLTVTNTQTKTLNFSVSVDDFQGSASDPYAAPVLLDGKVDSPISGAGWISIATKSFQLKPGATKNLTVKAKAPAGATGGHYAAVVIETGSQRISNNLTVQSRVGALFLMNAGGVGPPELVFEDVFVGGTNNDDLIVDFTNPGSTAADPDATFTTDPFLPGADGEVFEGTCTETLPGAAGQCVFEGAAGSSDGYASLVYDGEVELTNDGRKFTQAVPPRVAGGIKSLLLPIAGIGLFAGYFVFLRRRGEESDDEELMSLS